VCLRYALWSVDPPAWADLGFLVPPALIPPWSPRYNICLTDEAPVLTAQGAQRARFGCPGPQGRPVGNARDDQLARYWHGRLGRRCLVPASGYYEWTADKQPWYFTRRDRPVLCFAGLLGADCFAIVTTAANADCAGVHDRMPVVLDGPAARAWLDPALPDPAELAVPLPAGVLQRWRVGRSVGNVRSQGPELIAPLAAPAGLFDG
jgi:putative SOS response-associated peptidase YedK